MSETDALIPEFTLGDRLRKARELTGLDQATFAEEIGISRQSVGNYETGNTRPRKIVLLAWSMRTRVPVSWLEGEDYGGDVKRSHITALMRPAAAPSTAEIKAMRKALGHDIRGVSKRGARLS